MAETDAELDRRVAPALIIGEARIAADFLCRAEDWLRDVDPELACQAAGLLDSTMQVIERLSAESVLPNQMPPAGYRRTGAAGG